MVITGKARECCKDFLENLDDEFSVFEIAKTVGNSLVNVTTTESAVQTILDLSGNYWELLLSRKRITKQSIFRYLQRKGQLVSPALCKASLYKELIHFWGLDSTQYSAGDIIEDNRVSLSHSPPTVDYDVFGRQFVSWFYQMQNSVVSPSIEGTPNNQFVSQHFWNESSLELSVENQPGEGASFERFAGGENCIEAIKGLIVKEQLLFNPNLVGGIRSITSPYGLVMIQCCGTVHRGQVSQSADCVGVFDQRFGLARGLDGNYRVKVSHLALRGFCIPQGQGMPELPSITADLDKELLQLAVSITNTNSPVTNE